MKTFSSRQSAASASRASLVALPTDALAAITAHLSPADRAALAFTHPACAAALRTTRSSCTAHVAGEAQLAQLCQTLSTHPALVQLAVHWSGKRPIQLQKLVVPDSIRRLRLAFLTRQPSGGSVGAPSAHGVTALCLSGFNNAERRLNAGAQPWLAVLKEMPALQALSLLSLQTDNGLSQVTQLRSLNIAFPDHVDDDTPQDLLCPQCGDLHAEDVVDFLQTIKEEKSAIVGPHIANLPLLKTMVLDFASDADPNPGEGTAGLQGYNSLRNRFEWLGKRSASTPIFPALEKIDILNLPPLGAGPFCMEEALADAGADAASLRSHFFQTGRNMRNPLVIASLFTAVPSLVDYRVEYGRRQPGGPLPPPRPIQKQRDFESHFVHLDNGSVVCHYARRREGREAAAVRIAAAEE